MPATQPITMSLAEAPLQGVLRVTRVEAECDDAARLKAMGVCIGRRLSVVRSGDPLIVHVIGSRIGISARLAEQVYVEGEGEAPGEVEV